jgi:hypothetical protein
MRQMAGVLIGDGFGQRIHRLRQADSGKKFCNVFHLL